MRAWPLILCAPLSVIGCGGDDGGDGGGGPDEVSLNAGDTSLVARAKQGTIELRRGDAVLLSLPADAFVLGSVEEVTDAANYDPAPMLTGDPSAKEPEGLAWNTGVSFVIESHSATALTLRMKHEGGFVSTVELAVGADDRFTGKLTPADAARIAYLGVKPKVGATEAFYGLGEYFDSVNHRGKVRAMQLEVSSALESSNNEAHVPIPFVTGTTGFGLFVESRYPAAFDVAKTDPERLAAIFGTGLASDAGLGFHLFAAAQPLDVTRLYYDVTGYPRLPARWGLGPTVWRDENDDQAQVEADLTAMRTLDLATSAVWIDRPYATGVNTFDFDATKFTNAKAMIDKAHALGFRMSLWHTPYLDEKDPSTQALRDEATAKGYYPKERGLLLNKWGTPIDLTNPAAKAWWQSQIKKYIDLGIEGFKLDYGEDVVPGVFGARNIWQFSDGSDERTMHAGFPLLYHETYAGLLPDEGNFLLCRGGSYGDQVNVSVIWPGDLDASFARHAEKVTEKGQTYSAVGGLPAALIAGIGLGPSGFPFYGSDTGGYRHSPPDKELFTRWFQSTALSPVMQIGTSSNDVAWEPTADNGFDQEMLDWYRTYTRLHLRLFPYIWTYAKRLATDGRPIQRALGLVYPELGEHPDDVFLLGDSLLVAPVVERGKTSRDVPLPEGDWVDWWTGKSHTGAKSISVSAPLQTLPLFLKAGGIVPMLRPTIDTMSPTTDATVDSYATSPGVLWARVAPGPASSFVLFDGAEIGQEELGPSVNLTSKDGSELKYGVVFELVGFGAAPANVSDGGAALTQAASAAALDGAASGWAFEGGSLLVKVPAGTHSVSVVR
ncbi:MAG: glycoside hydrolase family 31 protein [Myxococcales bacterium]|nr:glycoside hydrolase family 31 protein [Myxococcales bacterium]